jgi:hypothetical protein
MKRKSVLSHLADQSLALLSSLPTGKPGSLANKKFSLTLAPASAGPALLALRKTFNQMFNKFSEPK